MSFRVEVNGVDVIQKNISKYSERVVEAVTVATQMAQAMIVNDAKNDHPYKDRTGNLTNSIQPGAIEISNEEVVGYVEARMQYATFVEFGTSRAKPYAFLTPAVIRNMAFYKKAMAKQLDSISL